MNPTQPRNKNPMGNFGHSSSHVLGIACSRVLTTKSIIKEKKSPIIRKRLSANRKFKNPDEGFEQLFSITGHANIQG